MAGVPKRAERREDESGAPPTMVLPIECIMPALEPVRDRDGLNASEKP